MTFKKSYYSEKDIQELDIIRKPVVLLLKLLIIIGVLLNILLLYFKQFLFDIIVTLFVTIFIIAFLISYFDTTSEINFMKDKKEFIIDKDKIQFCLSSKISKQYKNITILKSDIKNIILCKTENYIPVIYIITNKNKKFEIETNELFDHGPRIDNIFQNYKYNYQYKQI